MAEPYKFQYDPAAPDYDLERLKKSLMQNAQATQGLEALAPDIEYARGMQDTPIRAEENMYGFVDPFQTIANATRSDRGTRKLEPLQAREQELRGQVAEGQGQEALFNLYNARMEEERAAKKSVIDEEKLNLTQNTNIEKERLARETEARNQQNDALQRKIDSAPEGDFLGQYRDPSTETTISVSRDPKTGLTVNSSTGEPVDITNMVKVEDDSSSYKGGKYWTPTQTQEFAQIATQTRQVKKAIGDYKPKYSQIMGVETRFADAVMKGVTRNDLMKFVNKATDKETKEAMLWWADWTKLYTLPERYKAFGATLTSNELKSWAEAELMNPGSDGELTRQRMQKLGMDMENTFLNLADSQLSTSPESQRGHILKNTKGLADYNEFGEFGPTLNWKGKEAFINGDGAVVVEDKEGDKPPIVFPVSVPKSIIENMAEEDIEELRGLSDDDMIEILVGAGLMADPRGQARATQGGSVLPMSNPVDIRTPEQKYPSAIDTFGGEG